MMPTIERSRGGPGDGAGAVGGASDHFQSGGANPTKPRVLDRVYFCFGIAAVQPPR